jgi:hypothetical protein
MSCLNFDWLFGKAAPQAHPPVAGISEPAGSHNALTSSWYGGDLRGAVPCAGGGYTQNKTQTIAISGEDCEVTAHKTGKATWKAYGYLKGMPIQATDDTAHAAFRRWRDLAKTMLDE